MRASGGRKKLKGATLTCSRVAPSDREGPGRVPGWRLELTDHLVVVRSWLLHEPDLGLAKDDGARDWRGTRQRGESAVSVRARIANLGCSRTVLPYPVSATAAEKLLSHNGRGSFPSWTSPVRPRSPALESLAALVSAAPLTATFGILVLVPVAGRFKRCTASS